MRKAAHMGAHAFAEDVGAQVALEHREHAGALVVGESIERVRDVVVRRNRLADRARRRKGVDVHDVERIAQRFARELAVRPYGIGGLVAHPTREGFIQPDVVPPLRRDEVAEPLVRELVRVQQREVALLADRRIFVEQDAAFGVGDRARVLHAARSEIRRRDQVELRIGEGRCEVVLHEADVIRRVRQRKAGAVALALDGDAAQLQRLGA